MALTEACDTPSQDIVYVKDLLKDVVESTSNYLVTNNNLFSAKPVFFVHGVSEYVIEYFRLNLQNVPAIVFTQPYDEIIGVEYTTISIPRIIIVINYDKKDNLTERDEQTIKPILIPMYKSFLEQLVEHNSVVKADWKSLRHTKTIVPGWQPAANSLDLYLDAIEIKNLQFQIYNY